MPKDCCPIVVIAPVFVALAAEPWPPAPPLPPRSTVALTEFLPSVASTLVTEPPLPPPPPIDWATTPTDCPDKVRIEPEVVTVTPAPLPPPPPVPPRSTVAVIATGATAAATDMVLPPLPPPPPTDWATIPSDLAAKVVMAPSFVTFTAAPLPAFAPLPPIATVAEAAGRSGPPTAAEALVARPPWPPPPPIDWARMPKE
ncbi:hypothetical protein [Bosea sp. (in: a-proteobacteria)]|uniref:hypothetical protein n=1 Tax=Bosea sp. (in: a-proteobacteria) TaxID=1871050 RepID=UPI003F6FB393